MMEYIDKMEFDEDIALRLVKDKDIKKLKNFIKDKFKEIFIVQ